MDGVVHFEIPARDMERAKAFYSRSFGWKLNVFQSDYCVVHTGPVDEKNMPTKSGFINGAIQERSPQISMPRIVVSVDNLEQTIAAVEKNGGMLLQPKTEVPNMLWYAVVKDPEGNEIGLAQVFMKG